MKRSSTTVRRVGAVVLFVLGAVMATAFGLGSVLYSPNLLVDDLGQCLFVLVLLLTFGVTPALIGVWLMVAGRRSWRRAGQPRPLPLARNSPAT